MQETVLYNLDVVISVGYRVKSKRGTAFRIWARKILKDYLIKGYAVNERMRKEQIGELRQLAEMLGRTVQSQLENLILNSTLNNFFPYMSIIISSFFHHLSPPNLHRK